MCVCQLLLLLFVCLLSFLEIMINTLSARHLPPPLSSLCRSLAFAFLVTEIRRCEVCRHQAPLPDNQGMRPRQSFLPRNLSQITHFLLFFLFLELHENMQQYQFSNWRIKIKFSFQRLFLNILLLVILVYCSQFCVSRASKENVLYCLSTEKYCINNSVIT